MSKIFNTRLQLKYDFYEKWMENDPVLLAGEVAVVNVPAAEAGKVDNDAPGYNKKPAILFKVGDGTTEFSKLPWASGLAADVYAWAKKEHGSADDIHYKEVVFEEDGETVKTPAITVAEAISNLETTVNELLGDGSEGVEGGIAGIISNWVNNTLNYLDAEEDGYYVSEVKQSNGKISVKRKELPKLATGKTQGTVNYNGEDVSVNGLGSAAYAETTAFDAAGTGKEEAEKVLGTSTDSTLTPTVYGVQNLALKTLSSIGDLPENTTAVDYIDESINQVKTIIGEEASENKEATGLIKEISDNKANIALLNADKNTSGSVDNKIEAAKTELSTKIDNEKLVAEEITSGIEDSSIVKQYVFTTYGGREVARINIPKDLVVTSGSVETVETADTPYAGAAVGDKYIKLQIANQTAPIYIPAKSLVDVYKPEKDATEIQLAINANNEISASIVDGSISYDKLNLTVRNSLNNADSAVQLITTDNEAKDNANGTIVVDGESVAVKGLKSAAYEEASAFAAADILDNVNAEFNAADLEASLNISGKVISGIKQEKGKITQVTVTQLPNVAVTGSFYDLEEPETETEDYVIFYCGNSSKFTSEEPNAPKL